MTHAPHPGRLMLRQAVRLVVGNQFGSLNMLQRRLGVDWEVATSLLAELEAAGIVGPETLGVSRPVLVNADQVDEVLARFPETDDG